MSEQTKHHDASGNHITPFSTYLWVATALFTLTVITVTVAQIDFGPWNLVVAMLVASAKAILVALFFMHLLYDNKLYAAMFSGALLFLSIFIILTMFDTLGRGDISPEEGGPIRQRAVIYGEDGKPLKSLPHGEEHSEEAVEGDPSGEAGSTGVEDAGAGVSSPGSTDAESGQDDSPEGGH
jgi:caa(3)-type oxidase subunit IV